MPPGCLSSSTYTVNPVEQGDCQIPKATAPAATQTDLPLQEIRSDNTAHQGVSLPLFAILGFFLLNRLGQLWLHLFVQVSAETTELELREGSHQALSQALSQGNIRLPGALPKVTASG